MPTEMARTQEELRLVKDQSLALGFGTSPNIEVEQWASEVINGHDPQLEKAIQIIMEQLKSNPPKKAPVPKFPIKVRQ